MRTVGLRSVFPRVACAAVLALSFAMVVGLGSPASAQADVTVDMPGFVFAPVTITVPAGTRVTWTHSHMNIPHDVTSDTGLFSSPRRMMAGQTFSYTFMQPGTYAYTCTIHAERMKGTIIVTAQTAGTAATGGAAATVRPPATGTGGGAAVAVPTARPATVPAVMPRTGSGGTASAFVNEGVGTTNWMLLAGGLFVAGAICMGGVRMRRVRE